MRVSSLSNPKVAEEISRYFVPTWVSRDDYAAREPRSKEEKAELLRIDRERVKRGMKGGNVCVFIIAPNGDVLATQPVQIASNPEKHLEFLRKIIEDYKMTPRDEEAIRDTAAKPEEEKPKTKDGRIVHVWTRLERSGNRSRTIDRVELTAADCKEFLPAADARAGASWKIAESVAHKLYQYGYPPNPYWMVKDCKIEKSTLKATLSSLSDDEARIRLAGEMELIFPVGKPTEGRVTAKFVGYARVDRKKGALTALALVSDEAKYVWTWQGRPQPAPMEIALEMQSP
jgi:hypothetical protein